MAYEITFDKCSYYSMTLDKLEELKDMDYPRCDFNEDGDYSFEIGKMINKLSKDGNIYKRYVRVGSGYVTIENCKATMVKLTVVF